MNTKFIFLTISTLLMASCNTADDVEVIEAAHQSKVKIKTAASADFKVSEQLLHKYLNLKKDKPSRISPIVVEGDTLAYELDYEKGWKLISGDQRLTPEIAQSDNNKFDFSDIHNPESSSISGLLNYIQEIRKSNKTEKNAVWDFLSNNVPDNGSKKSARKVQARGIGMGMWIPTDTTYDTNTSTFPHIISTSWHQSSPYNYFTPLVLDTLYNRYVNAPVGCVPVAAGQVIYHYRKNNHRGVFIPIAATGADNAHKNQFIITTSSSAGWSYLNMSYYVSIFLRYLGLQMGTNYGFPYSGTYAPAMGVVRDYYLIDFDMETNYDYPTLMTSLRQNSPAIIGGESITNNHHFFIIDGYKEVSDVLSIKYEWDENHIITDDEYLRYPQIMFEPDPKGDTEKYVELNASTSTYITMNWGGTSPNSNWYIAHEYSSGYEGEDFAGSFNYPHIDYIYPPYWNINSNIYNSVLNMYYNFREYYPEENSFEEHVP